MRFRAFLFAALVAWTWPSQADAQIYAWRDANGTLVLSDRSIDAPTAVYKVPGTPSYVTTRPAEDVSDDNLYEPLILEHATRQSLRPELVRAAIESGEPTAWFDRLYGEGERGEVSMPWDRRTANPVLEDWARSQDLSGTGRRAVVVGCGLGADAEFLSSLGFAVTAFDVSQTAVRLAAQRNPGSSVDYRQADLLDRFLRFH